MLLRRIVRVRYRGDFSGVFRCILDICPPGSSSIPQSCACRFSKNSLSHLTGLLVHAPSSPLVIESPPLPLPWLLFQPKPLLLYPGPPPVRGPTWSSGAAPCALPNVCPPAMSATVSSSSIAMRLNVWRMYCAAAHGSGLPFGPSGFT